MTPNKLPPLPFTQFGMPPAIKGFPSEPLFTADQMHAYADEALRQSQSLPAGAVAGLVGKWRELQAIYADRANRATDDRDAYGDSSTSDAYEECADLLEQALQADAREKGEAGHKPVAFRWLRNGLPVCSWTDGVPPETAMQRADDLKGYADWQVEYAYSSLATQPAQASENADRDWKATCEQFVADYKPVGAEAVAVLDDLKDVIAIGNGLMTDEFTTNHENFAEECESFVIRHGKTLEQILSTHPQPALDVAAIVWKMDRALVAAFEAGINGESFDMLTPLDALRDAIASPLQEKE